MFFFSPKSALICIIRGFDLKFGVSHLLIDVDKVFAREKGVVFTNS